MAHTAPWRCEYQDPMWQCLDLKRSEEARGINIWDWFGIWTFFQMSGRVNIDTAENHYNSLNGKIHPSSLPWHTSQPTGWQCTITRQWYGVLCCIPWPFFELYRTGDYTGRANNIIRVWHTQCNEALYNEVEDRKKAERGTLTGGPKHLLGHRTSPVQRTTKNYVAGNDGSLLHHSLYIYQDCVLQCCSQRALLPEGPVQNHCMLYG